MTERIVAFSDIPPSITAVLRDHAEQGSADLQAEQPLAADLAGRFIGQGMTASVLVNNVPGTLEVPHHVVQALGEDDIFYIDPEWMAVGQGMLPDELPARDHVLCYRTAEVPRVASWFSGLVDGPTGDREAAEALARTVWDPASYRLVPEPRPAPQTYSL